MARLYSLIIDEDLPFYELVQDALPEWNAWARNHETYLCWWPLAYSQETDDYFTQIAIEKDISWRPIPPEHVIATATTLERPLTI